MRSQVVTAAPLTTQSYAGRLQYMKMYMEDAITAFRRISYRYGLQTSHVPTLPKLQKSGGVSEWGGRYLNVKKNPRAAPPTRLVNSSDLNDVRAEDLGPVPSRNSQRVRAAFGTGVR